MCLIGTPIQQLDDDESNAAELVVRINVATSESTGSILATASRQSKIGHVDQLRQHACKPRYDQIPKFGKQPASSLNRSRTLSQTLRATGTVPPPFLDNSKIGHSSLALNDVRHSL